MCDSGLTEKIKMATLEALISLKLSILLFYYMQILL